MTQETAKERKICGFQPKGNSEDVPRPPLFKPANTDKLSVEKLQEQLNTAKKALTEIEAAVAEFADDGDYNFNFAGNLASEALAAIEYEGSGDE